AHWAEEFAARPFHWVELGAGEGKLAGTIAASLQKDHPELAADIVYSAVERSDTRRQALERLHHSMPRRFNVHDSFLRIKSAPLTGVFFANELIDAFPVHRVRMHEGRLQEAYVEPGAAGGPNRWVWDTPSTPDLARYFRRLNLALPDGYETEVNLDMKPWIAGIARVLESGFVVVIDYGRPAARYYHPERPQG